MSDEINELIADIRAGYPFIYIASWEEKRVEKTLSGIAEGLKKSLVVWSGLNGVEKGADAGVDTRDAKDFIKKVATTYENTIVILKDFHNYIQDIGMIRLIRDIEATVTERRITFVVVSPVFVMPPELEKDFTLVDMPLPDQKALGVVLMALLQTLKASVQFQFQINPETLDNLARAALGLTEKEANKVFRKVFINRIKTLKEAVDLVLYEKKQLIRDSKFLEFFEFDEALEGVGGMEVLKEWLTDRAKAFGEKAREFGLPAPKGIMLLGVQGCGKSLTAKAVGRLWQLPLLRLDLGGIFSAEVGSSEENMRKAIKISESLSPAILWIDEIEKAFANSGEQGGTLGRVLGTLITWLQEKKKPVFVIATANNIASMPPELMRKGRFDEIFFVDLPSVQERRDILAIHIKKRGRKPDDYDLKTLARLSEGYSGAELEQVVISALYRAFSSTRQITTEDLEEAIKETVPLSRTMDDAIKAQREWAKHRARNAALDTKLLDLFDVS